MKFIDNIPASKSYLNRALIIQSYFPHLKVMGENACEDVSLLKTALSNLNAGSFICGDGGTTFRFLVLRLSRYPGEHKIELSANLLARPHDELFEILDQLHIKYKLEESILVLQGDHWFLKNGIDIYANRSSQFLSSILLNAWLLEEPLHIYIKGDVVSGSYLNMTIDILESLGMKLQVKEGQIFIDKMQQVNKSNYLCELDLSSAFSIAAIASIKDGCSVDNFPFESKQADLEFLNVFEALGLKLTRSESALKVYPCKKITPIQYSLKNCPDLFPVLAILCAFAEGESKLYGAPQLVHKETNRIQSISSLLSKMSIQHKRLEDGIEIFGQHKIANGERFSFDCSKDHRLAFACALAKTRGYSIEIIGHNSVNKSYVNFWDNFSESFLNE